MAVYLQGFSDELDNANELHLIKRAYNIGKQHAIIGDDIESVDYLTDEEILVEIKNKL